MRWHPRDLYQINSFVLAAVMLIATARVAIAQSVCADVTNAWSEVGGGTSGSLVQAANGTIGGELEVNCQSSLLTFGVNSGTYHSDGSFSIAATYNEQEEPPAGCATTIYINGSIAQPGCDSVAVTFSNNLGGVGGFTWTATAVLPESESTSFLRYDFDDSAPTEGIFQPNITRSVVTFNGVDPDYNFGGRTIVETFPDPSTDSCWFSNSKYPKFKPTAAAPFVLPDDAGDEYEDLIGVANDADGGNEVLYSRYFQRAPCDFTTTQVMTISTSSGPVGYATNFVDIEIGTATFQVSRGTVVAPAETWGVTQQQYQSQKGILQEIDSYLFTH